jgi:hypothetical protein
MPGSHSSAGGGGAGGIIGGVIAALVVIGAGLFIYFRKYQGGRKTRTFSELEKEGMESASYTLNYDPPAPTTQKQATLATNNFRAIAANTASSAIEMQSPPQPNSPRSNGDGANRDGNGRNGNSSGAPLHSIDVALATSMGVEQSDHSSSDVSLSTSISSQRQKSVNWANVVRKFSLSSSLPLSLSIFLSSSLSLSLSVSLSLSLSLSLYPSLSHFSTLTKQRP